MMIIEVSLDGGLGIVEAYYKVVYRAGSVSTSTSTATSTVLSEYLEG